MHESLIETNIFRTYLVFHDIRIEKLGNEVSVDDKITIRMH